MITVNLEERPVRQTFAEYKHVENGEVKIGEIRIRYFAKTTKEFKEEHAFLKAQLEKLKKEEAKKKAGAKSEDKTKAQETPKVPEVPDYIWHSDILVEKLESLPDLINQQTGKPFDITIDFLDALDPENLRSIAEAIREDENPKSKPA